ncbi:MAG: tRNA (uridine(54)-C5)-methyltransferase TrmA [Epsilonproteobacteria bacterium]|nr:tRNA (uridine(54)-C5)-methyltransferase TrmA [Campylobacterota bacterium]NPA57294.1 tRNA (uridine(54)-C5)-methyltransferase TrmA [Campylobacterota bacterium]
MECRYFGECGSCRLYGEGYRGQLQRKVERVEELLGVEPRPFPSPPERFRARAEFRILSGEGGIQYAMHRREGGVIAVHECPILLDPIFSLFSPLREELGRREELRERLFRVDFLSGLSGELLVSLVYHREIGEEWEREAREVGDLLGIKIVGRSRGKKRVVGRDFIYEELPIGGRSYRYLHYEGSFTQPNPYINREMIQWALEMSRDFGGDLVELYCGGGNFTLPLAQNFGRVIATEVSRLSIKAAQEAVELNGIGNITFIRMSSQEFGEALTGRRKFRRLEGVDLSSLQLESLLVDPPRSGLDPATLRVAKNFRNILYISCNPSTLRRDLDELEREGFSLEEVALFDQFPYTEHIEVGVLLRKG